MITSGSSGQRLSTPMTEFMQQSWAKTSIAPEVSICVCGDTQAQHWS